MIADNNSFHKKEISNNNTLKIFKITVPTVSWDQKQQIEQGLKFVLLGVLLKFLTFYKGNTFEELRIKYNIPLYFCVFFGFFFKHFQVKGFILSKQQNG